MNTATTTKAVVEEPTKIKAYGCLLEGADEKYLFDAKEKYGLSLRVLFYDAFKTWQQAIETQEHIPSDQRPTAAKAPKQTKADLAAERDALAAELAEMKAELAAAKQPQAPTHHAKKA